MYHTDAATDDQNAQPGRRSLPSKNGKGSGFEIHGVSCQEIRDKYKLIRSADALLLLYDTTDAQLRAIFRHWAAKALFDGIPCALVGTRFSIGEGKRIAQELGVEFIDDVEALLNKFPLAMQCRP